MNSRSLGVWTPRSRRNVPHRAIAQARWVVGRSNGSDQMEVGPRDRTEILLSTNLGVPDQPTSMLRIGEANRARQTLVAARLLGVQTRRSTTALHECSRPVLAKLQPVETWDARKWIRYFSNANQQCNSSAALSSATARQTEQTLSPKAEHADPKFNYGNRVLNPAEAKCFARLHREIWTPSSVRIYQSPGKLQTVSFAAVRGPLARRAEYST